MGLDITAVSSMQFVHGFDSEDHDDDECDGKGYTQVYSMTVFTERLDGIQQSCYIFPEEIAKVVNFRAGSYCWYNNWRELLSVLALGVPSQAVYSNLDQYRGRPCFELVWMADNEGAIGPDTSRKLAADFEQLRPSAIERFGHDDGWIGLFDQWHAAFQLASQGGVVSFH